jgi:hypothetical protein
MIKATKAQLPKKSIGAMADVNMSSTPLMVIGREACLWAKGPFRLLKDLGLKRHLNTLWKEESKEIMDSMKVEDGSVHHKRYNGHYKGHLNITHFKENVHMSNILL